LNLGLEGRRYLVGGASRGLGAAVARALAGEGARVALVARESDDLAAIAQQTAGQVVAADLSQPNGATGAVESAAEALGGLDGLLVNSGGPPSGTFEDVDEGAWERAVAGTLMGSIRLIRAVLPHIRSGQDPSILVILSSSVREPIPALITSNTLRPALSGLIKSLATEIAPIRINGVAPGRFDTQRVRSLDESRARQSGISVEAVQEQTRNRIPLGRYGDPDELGRVAAFLLSPAASYVHGQVVGVDGGMVRSLP
jgi:3-oxoacyl-[acyl-carrier protein] reductase